MRGPLDYQWVGPYDSRPPPSPEALPLLQRALEIYRDSFQEFAAKTNDPGTAWGSVGLDLLLATARVLERYHARVEFREGHEEDLRMVREVAREVDRLLATNRFLGPIGWGHNLDGLPGILFLSRLDSGYSLCETRLDAGGLWFERPADALEPSQRILEPSVYPAIRGQFLSTSYLTLPLPAWSCGRDSWER